MAACYHASRHYVDQINLAVVLGDTHLELGHGSPMTVQQEPVLRWRLS